MFLLHKREVQNRFLKKFILHRLHVAAIFVLQHVAFFPFEDICVKLIISGLHHATRLELASLFSVLSSSQYCFIAILPYANLTCLNGLESRGSKIEEFHFLEIKKTMKEKFIRVNIFL